MTAKEALEKIKQLFQEAAPAPANITMKTKDGKTLSMSALKVGEKCMLMDAEVGQPIPDGTYEMEDGTKITCVDGIITEVIMPEPESPELEVAMKAMFKQLSDEFSNKMNDYMQRIEALENKIAAMEKANAAFTAQVIEGFKLVEAIAEQPAPHVPTKPESFAAQKKTATEKKLADIAAAINKLNNN
jgi:hypothetical protein